MVKGTRLLIGEEADLYFSTCQGIRAALVAQGFNEILLPSMWDQQTFIDKAGPEIINQMYAFKDKGDRDICLIPECTAVVQKMWNDEWHNRVRHPMKIFYIQRCYRYEKPQAGRHREFTQAGVELLGNRVTKEDAVKALKETLNLFGIPYQFNDTVKRGLSYYVEDGFEAEVSYLGAQKQIAGGGRYKEGIGWAIGVDRLMLAIQGKPSDEIGVHVGPLPTGRWCDVCSAYVTGGDHTH
jgi:histidyl-tRNA synthetase